MSTKIESLSLINTLLPTHDYSNDNCYLVFTHNVKPTQTKEIKADWFDFNCGEKVDWLLLRECEDDCQGKKKYRNIKIKNIDPSVKIVLKKD